MSAALDARFVAARDGRRFWLHHAPGDGKVSASLLYVHPFAEEMNKSRRVAAVQARAFAARGCAVLQVDLRGCGDSDGDFADTAWSDWVDDLERARAWLAERHGVEPTLWALRAGALVVAAWAASRAAPVSLLLWQPVASGRQHLTQFLRTRALADALGGQAGDGGVRAMREALHAGAAQEVAGYVLGAPLALGLDAAELHAPPAGSRVTWIETGTEPECAASPVARAHVARWRDAGVDVRLESVPGPAFWQTVELAESPALVARTSSIVMESA